MTKILTSEKEGRERVAEGDLMTEEQFDCWLLCWQGALNQGMQEASRR